VDTLPRRARRHQTPRTVPTLPVLVRPDGVVTYPVACSEQEAAACRPLLDAARPHLAALDAQLRQQSGGVVA
jgi:hypothetical protein